MRVAAEIFREYAALSGIAGRLGRDFDISGLADISDADYAALRPVYWPLAPHRSGGRFFASGGFFTPDGKARARAVISRPPAAAPSPEYPFVLNTGRVRDQWHTMTRTALSPRLSAHLAEPYLDIHPADASRLGLQPAALVTVSSPIGQAILRARVTEAVQPGTVFAPMHWTGELSSAGRIDALVPPVTDPVSGQPESKAVPVAVAPFAAAAFGFAVSARDPKPNAPYWAKARTAGGWRVELAWTEAQDWAATAAALFGLDAPGITVEDPARGQSRIAFLEDGRLQAALFVAPEPVALSRDHVVGALGQDGAKALSGRPGADVPDPGPTICACFDVGLHTIRRAIAEQDLTSVEAIGAALRAGTNCGSCRPELNAILGGAERRLAAE